jgi:methionine salvage enolase-phosphatase E1
MNDSILDSAFGDNNPVITDKNDLNSIADYVSWKIGHKKLHPQSPVSKVKAWIIDEGYAEGNIKAPVFADAAKAVAAWRFGEYFIKNYTLTSMEKEVQKKYIKYTSAGDLMPCFNNYIELSAKSKATEQATYETICKMVRDSPDNLLLITDSINEARAANEIGMMTIVIHRKGEPTPREEQGIQISEENFVPTIVSSFEEIGFINDPKKPPPCC